MPEQGLQGQHGHKESCRVQCGVPPVVARVTCVVAGIQHDWIPHHGSQSVIPYRFRCNGVGKTDDDKGPQKSPQHNAFKGTEGWFLGFERCSVLGGNGIVLLDDICWVHIRRLVRRHGPHVVAHVSNSRGLA